MSRCEKRLNPDPTSSLRQTRNESTPFLFFPHSQFLRHNGHWLMKKRPRLQKKWKKESFCLDEKASSRKDGGNKVWLGFCDRQCCCCHIIILKLTSLPADKKILLFSSHSPHERVSNTRVCAHIHNDKQSHTHTHKHTSTHTHTHKHTSTHTHSLTRSFSLSTSLFSFTLTDGSSRFSYSRSFSITLSLSLMHTHTHTRTKTQNLTDSHVSYHLRYAPLSTRY